MTVNTPKRPYETTDIGSELAAALVAFQGEVGSVAKDVTNTFFKSKYADLPAVKAEAQPLLQKHGLAVIQEPKYVIIEGKAVDTLTTTVVHTSGQNRSSTMILRPVKNDPQAQGSAITYAKRYAFMAILGLVADEDDDGNAASGNRKPAAAKPRKAAPADDGVDQAELNAANADLKAAARELGLKPGEVVTEFAAKFTDNLASTRSIENLRALTDIYRTELAKKALGGSEVTE